MSPQQPDTPNTGRTFGGWKIKWMDVSSVALVVAGGAVVFAGLWWIFPPLALVALGVALAVVGLLLFPV